MVKSDLVSARCGPLLIIPPVRFRVREKALCHSVQAGGRLETVAA
jgi:hypothetical protein